MHQVDALLRRLVGPAFRRQGFTESDVVSRWPQIVGPLLADHSMPERLKFGRDGGTLHITVNGPFALEMQHLEPVIVDRINTYFGYRAVTRLSLHQAPLPPLSERRRGPPPPDESALAEAEETLADDGPPELKAALTRLGGYVLSRAQKAKNSNGN